MTTILIAEDDKSLQMLIRARLKPYYEILCADDGLIALEMIQSRHIDLLIADIGMPRMDGFELVQKLRSLGSTLPVLMLTAKQSFQDKRTGFSAGTDDYLTKPVNYEELLWRIQALLRRAKIFTSKEIEVGAVVLDSLAYTVRKTGGNLELPKKEFDLLFKLLSYPGRIFTKQQLLDDIWGNSFESGEDTVKTHISRLRGKLDSYPEFTIVTVKGLGYKAEITEQGHESP